MASSASFRSCSLTSASRARAVSGIGFIASMDRSSTSMPRDSSIRDRLSSDATFTARLSEDIRASRSLSVFSSSLMSTCTWFMMR